MPTAIPLDRIYEHVALKWPQWYPAFKTALLLLKSSRPPGWCFGPILYGMGMINSKALPKKPAELLISTLQVVSLSLPLCFIVFGINDVYDYSSDLLNPRKVANGLEGTILPPIFHLTMRQAAHVSSAFIIATASLHQDMIILTYTILLVALGWQYSAPPLRLKEVPLVDSLSNGAIVFLCWRIGFCSPKTGRDKSLQSSKGYILALCTTGVHALGAVVDVASDAAARQRTIATVLGAQWATCFSFTTYLISLYLEGLASIFGLYLCGGLITTLGVLLTPGWAHRAFQVLVYWTVLMSVVWFVVRLSSRR